MSGWSDHISDPLYGSRPPGSGPGRQHHEHWANTGNMGFPTPRPSDDTNQRITETGDVDLRRLHRPMGDTNFRPLLGTERGPISSGRYGMFDDSEYISSNFPCEDDLSMSSNFPPVEEDVTVSSNCPPPADDFGAERLPRHGQAELPAEGNSLSSFVSSLPVIDFDAMKNILGSISQTSAQSSPGPAAKLPDNQNEVSKINPVQEKQSNDGLNQKGSITKSSGSSEKNIEGTKKKEPANWEHCDVCDISFKNHKEYQVHMFGMLHARKALEAPKKEAVEEHCAVTKNVKDKHDKGSSEKNIEGTKKKEPANWEHCDVCNISFKNHKEYQVHMFGMLHARKALEFETKKEAVEEHTAVTKNVKDKDNGSGSSEKNIKETKKKKVPTATLR